MSRFARRLSRGAPFDSGSSGRTWPDDTTTGPSGTLTNSGNVTITANGALVENLNIAGVVTIDADNVILRNCYITSGGYYGLVVNGANALIEDCTIEGNNWGTASVLSVDGYSTMRRIDVFGGEDGIRMGNNSKLYDSYVHDLYENVGSHNDAVTADGFTGWEIVHNRIINSISQTACIWAGDPRYGPSEGLVENNYLAGGGYTIYSGHSTGRGLRFVDNVFSTQYYPNSGSYGPIADWQPVGNTWTNNIWYDGPQSGQPVIP